MSCSGGVGQGVTLGLSIDTVIGRVRNVQMPEWLAEAVDFSALDNVDWMCFLPGSLADPGQFVAEVYFDTTIAIPTVNLIQVATFTFPIQNSSNGTKATLTGSGFVTGLGFPNAAIAEPLIQTITFKYDGNGTVPAFSLETA